MHNIKKGIEYGIKSLFQLFQKDRFMNWDDYTKKITFLDVFHWQQSVRKQNIENGESF